MGKKKQSLDSHVESVNALFDQLNQAALSESNWLAALRKRALKKDVGWKAEADSYVRGLVAAGAISADVEAACRENLGRSVGSDLGLGEILVPVALIAVIAAVAVTWRSNDIAWLAVLMVLAAALGFQWGRTRPSLNPGNNPRQVRWTRPFGITACVVLVPLLAYFIVAITGEFVEMWSFKQFNVERAAFLANPQGFPWLKKLAKEQYGVEVALGDASQGWSSTTINLPNAKVASMELRPGYCRLHFHRENVLRSYGPTGKLDNSLLVQGTMMHELAHCLDGSRDMPAFGQKTIATRALCPLDANEVKDIQGYLDAETRPSTRLWQEAVADTFAVGGVAPIKPDRMRLVTGCG